MNFTFDTFSFDTFSQLWADAMLQATLQGVVLITIVLATVFLFGKHFTSRTSCWLWRLAFLKLILLMLVFKPIGVPVLPSVPILPTQAAIGGGSAVAVNAAPSDSLNGLPQNDIAFLQPDLEAGGTASPLQSPVLLSNFSLPKILFALWLTGVLICLCLLTRYWSSSQKLRKLSVPLEDSRIYEYCRELCDQFEIKSVPQLSVSEVAASPLLIGIFSPQIIFPATTLATIDSEQIKLVIAHELSHLKRRDLWWSWIPAVSAVLFFFNPLVWWARGRWQLSREMACDELVLLVTETSAAKYANALIDVSNCVRKSDSTPIASRVVGSTCMIQTSHALQRRIKAMKNYSKFSSYSLHAMILFGLASLIVVMPWKLVQSQEKAVETSSADTNEVLVTPSDDLNPSIEKLDKDGKPAALAQEEENPPWIDSPSYFNDQLSLATEYQIRAREASKSGDRDAVIANLKKAVTALENVIEPMFAAGPEGQRSVGQLLQVPRLLSIKTELGSQEGALARFDDLFKEAHKLFENLPNEKRLKIFIAHRNSAISVRDYDRAIEVLEQAFGEFDDTKLKQSFVQSSAKVFLMKAKHFDDLDKREDYIGRIVAICESLYKNPAERDAYEMLIDVIAKTKSNDKRMVWLKESLLTSPRMSLMHLLLGLSMIREGDIQKGKSHLKIALRSDEARTKLVNIIDVVSSDKENRIDDILEINLIALELLDSPSLHQSLGINQLRLGSVETAIKHFDVAIERQPALIRCHHYLIQCYEKLEDPDKAKYHQEKLDEYFNTLDQAQRDRVKSRLKSL